ncbi:MAG: hypothetical protein M3Z09_13500 [Acidobacteriota bacterium]|nr:hypothetical protein [Acidobacteriota bacterium]
MSPQPAKPAKSTGPRTEAGKAASSQNALRHGLASGAILIPGEDPAEFQTLEQALFEQHQPANATETLLVADLAKHHWLKDRALRLQAETLAAAKPGELPATFAVFLRYQSTNERAFHKALATLNGLRKEQLAQERQFVSQKEKQADREAWETVERKLFAPPPQVPMSEFIENIRKSREQRKLQLDPQS